MRTLLNLGVIYALLSAASSVRGDEYRPLSTEAVIADYNPLGLVETDEDDELPDDYIRKSDLDEILRELEGIAKGTPAPPAKVAVPAEAAPTPQSEVDRVLALLPTPTVGYADLGCGDGRWLFAAAERWPTARITGVEIDPARAAATRERVRDAGLSGRITVITGDATTTDVPADVITLYLYPEVITKLTPRLRRMRAVASYLHKPDGLDAVQNGDSWIYLQPVAKTVAAPVQAAAVQQPIATWEGKSYTHAPCDNPKCWMCNGPIGINAQLNAQRNAMTVAQPAKSQGRWVKQQYCTFDSRGRKTGCYWQDVWVADQ